MDRECHDANGGKHRFRIPLPNQLLRTFQNKKLCAHGIAVAGNVENVAIAGSGNFFMLKGIAFLALRGTICNCFLNSLKFWTVMAQSDVSKVNFGFPPRLFVAPTVPFQLVCFKFKVSLDLLCKIIAAASTPEHALSLLAASLATKNQSRPSHPALPLAGFCISCSTPFDVRM